MKALCGTVSLGSWPKGTIGEDSAAEVDFCMTFDSVPTVVAQLSSVDMAAPQDKQIEVWTSDETHKGFRLHARTWDGSVAWGAAVSWVALTSTCTLQAGVVGIAGSRESPLSDEEDSLANFTKELQCEAGSSPCTAVWLCGLEASGQQHLHVQSQTGCVNNTSFAIRCSTRESSVTWGVKIGWVVSASPHLLQCGAEELGAWPHDVIKDGTERSVSVAFPRPFDRAPAVAVALAGLHTDCSRPLRVQTWADNITAFGCKLHVRSWEDSITWWVKLTWLATPAAATSAASRIPPHLPPREYQVVGPPIGEGWSGVTHKAVCTKDGRTYAVKTCRQPFRQHEQELWKELRNLCSLPAHANLLQFHGFLLRADRVHIITEYLDAFKLSDLVAGQGVFVRRHQTSTMLRWLGQLFDGLAHMHQAGITHRDLHGENILVEKEVDGTPSQHDHAVRIIDFGAAKVHGQNKEALMSIQAGCWQYFSPERRRGKEFDDRDDVWAAGCHLVELATGVLISKRAGCGHDGVDFAILPAQITAALHECGDGRCGQLARRILTSEAESRPRAAAARDLCCMYLQPIPVAAGSMATSMPSGGSCTCSCSATSCLEGTEDLYSLAHRLQSQWDGRVSMTCTPNPSASCRHRSSKLRRIGPTWNGSAAAIPLKWLPHSATQA